MSKTKGNMDSGRPTGIVVLTSSGAAVVSLIAFLREDTLSGSPFTHSTERVCLGMTLTVTTILTLELLLVPVTVMDWCFSEVPGPVVLKVTCLQPELPP